jgi:hypothetical protein
MGVRMDTRTRVSTGMVVLGVVDVVEVIVFSDYVYG